MREQQAQKVVMKSRTRIGISIPASWSWLGKIIRQSCSTGTASNDHGFQQRCFNRSDNRFVGAVLHP